MGYNTVEAPILLDYETALAHYHSVKPIRNKTVRPLGARRYHREASIALLGDDVALIYYGQPLTIWHPDNTLTVFYPAYCNSYEPEKLAHFLPPGLSFAWNKVRLVVHNLDTDEAALLRRGDKIRFVPTGATKPFHLRERRVWAFDNMPVEYNYVKRANVLPKLVEQHMSAFLRWFDDTAKIVSTIEDSETNEVVGRLLYEATGGTPRDVMDLSQKQNSIPWIGEPVDVKRKHEMNHELALIDYYPLGGKSSYKPKWHHLAGVRILYNWMLQGNEERWYDALCVLVRRQIRMDWQGRVYEINGVGDREDIVDYITKIVGIVHRDEVYKRVELSKGVLPSRTNREVFNDYSFQHFPEKTDSVSDISTQAGE